MELDLYKKFKERVKKQGLFSALSYFLLTVGGEKLGVEIVKLFIFKQKLVKFTIESNIQVFNDFSKMPSHLINELNASCGMRFSSSAAYKLENNAVLAVGLVDNHAASIAWLKKVDSLTSGIPSGGWLIHGCLTFPQYRGLGLYPNSIKKLCNYIIENTHNGARTNIFIESSIANSASISGITQSDFEHFKTLIRYNDKAIYSTTKNIREID